MKLSFSVANKILIYLILCCTSYVFADNGSGMNAGSSNFSNSPSGSGLNAGGNGNGSGTSFGNNSSSGTNSLSGGGNNVPLINQGDSGEVQLPQIIGSDLVTQQNIKDDNNGLSNGSANQRASNRAIRMQQPEIPDEFQISVAIRTGQKLKKYGYDLFNNSNSFTPPMGFPVSNNYVIGPGDDIKIHGWGAVDINYVATVANDGTIFVPRVGQISLSGVKSSDLDKYLRSKIGKIYKNFSVATTVSKIKSIQITVAGFSRNPGSYTISSISTITSAVFATSGPSEQGSLRHIQLKRSGIVVADFDMYDLLLKGDDSKDIRLLSGDIVYIRPHGQQVAIYDGVKVPGIYETRDNETIANVVLFAGGYTFNNTKQQIIVEKLSDRNKIDVFNYAFDAGLRQPVSNGEIIHFFRMPNRYNDAVVLMGNVANPSRFNWHEGLTIKDLIPTKEALLTKSFWNSYSQNSLVKDSLLEAQGREKTNNWASTATPKSSYSNDLNSNGSISPGPSGSTYGQSGQQPGQYGQSGPSGQSSQSGQYDQSGQMSTNAENPDSQANIGPFSKGANVFNAGPISIPEADINWQYAVVIRIDPDKYSSIILPFDLEEALKGNPKDNLILKPGDIINILSSKDVRNPEENGDVFVFIDGEVKRPGVYELNSGASLVEAINAAGGKSSGAYLFGLELDRLSVKKHQKAALDQMLDNLQQALSSQSINNLQTAPGPASSANNSAILAQQQAFVNKLRTLKPTGRVVLRMPNDKVDLTTIPNIVLENGDTIYIPPRPSTVDVIGQVYSPATFMYEPKFTVGDYIDFAGRTNDFADTSNIYVLRADGTLYSKQQGGWFSPFDSKKLYAGDAIIVPQKIQFSSLTQNLIDWTTILANLGFGTAAIKQLGQ